MREADLARRFPGLAAAGFRITSPPTTAYNCIAWAGEDTGRWWSPMPFELYFWPEGVPRENTLAAWEAALATVGYEPCDDPLPEDADERIAIYGIDGEPLHVARRLPGGRWTSKLGRSEDIEHDLDALCGEGGYGAVLRILRRRRGAGRG